MTETTSPEVSVDGPPDGRRRMVRWLPFALAAFALVGLNLGMHTRLSASSTDLPAMAASEPVEEPVSITEPAPATAAAVVGVVAAPVDDLVAGSEQVPATPVADRPPVTLAGEVTLVAPPTPPVATNADPAPPVAAPSAVAVGTVDIRGAGPEAVDAASLIDEFDVAGADGWAALGGSWAPIDGRLVQDQASGYDLSFVRNSAVGYPMVWRATLEHLDGAGAGLLFDLPTPDGLAGGHLVRYMGDGDALAWGAFDEDGVFAGQGGTSVPAPGQALHELEVRSDGQTYDVVLDGDVLAAAVPLVDPSPRHHVGLSTSEARVAFDRASLDVGESAAALPALEATMDERPADASRGTLAISAASGTWTADGAVVRQTADALTDHVADLGVAAGSFKLGTELAIDPASSGMVDTGAGLIFGMRNEADRRGAYMVRFGSGGTELFWGRFDATGTFQGEGGEAFPGRAGQTTRLEVLVDGSTLDIRADDRTVAAGIPVADTAGRLGLIAFGGPVEFSDLTLEVTR